MADNRIVRTERLFKNPPDRQPNSFVCAKQPECSGVVCSESLEPDAFEPLRSGVEQQGKGSADRVTLGDISGPAPGFGEEPIPSLHLTVPGCSVGEAMLLCA